MRIISKHGVRDIFGAAFVHAPSYTGPEVWTVAEGAAVRGKPSQPTPNRILRGERAAKMTEVILIADATGCTVAQLTGRGVADRARCAAPATYESSMTSMRQRLLHFMELDAFLDDQAIPAA